MQITAMAARAQQRHTAAPAAQWPLTGQAATQRFSGPLDPAVRMLPEGHRVQPARHLGHRQIGGHDLRHHPTQVSDTQPAQPGFRPAQTLRFQRSQHGVAGRVELPGQLPHAPQPRQIG